MNYRHLDDRQHAIVLFALRFLQANLNEDARTCPDWTEFNSYHGCKLCRVSKKEPTPEEIDSLCEEINT